MMFVAIPRLLLLNLTAVLFIKVADANDRFLPKAQRCPVGTRQLSLRNDRHRPLSLIIGASLVALEALLGCPLVPLGFPVDALMSPEEGTSDRKGTDSP